MPPAKRPTKRAPARKKRMVLVHLDGHSYTFDAEAVSIDTLEDIDDQHYIRAARDILGDEQWALYKKRHPRATQFNDLLTALFEAMGNSPASDDS